MPGNEQEFIESIASPLGWYYLFVCALNVGAAVYCLRTGRDRRGTWAWLMVAVVFGLLGGGAFLGKPLGMPAALKTAIDAVLGPVTFTFGTLAVLSTLYLGRRFFVRPAVAWSGLCASLVFMGASMTDPEFAAVIGKPDNVPIVAMVYLLGFFTWLGAYQGVKNDERLRRGAGPVEGELRDKVLVWPDLVYVELIAMVIASVILIVWSIALRAPLEQPANPVVTPNPSKAPWYFLGLQEMLVFFDASIAGVILPALIILGLMAIPYLDVNRKGNGYYTIAERKFSYVVFHFGFLQLWILLILIGTFMRGPNWNFFGLYEPRDAHKVVALANVKLSEYFWAIWLGMSVPRPPSGSGAVVQLGWIVWREILGIVLLAAYFGGLPVLLGRTILKPFREQMGRGRYAIMVLLLLMMLMLPLKMILRWSFNLSYIVSIPEYFFNF
ncbi:MAG TPA: PLDc N-terminal domain-containing protein [Thermoguttaceae bacterium]|nr:PLDc N-terminal domain-containing protein [Thermoguttaceae bacterium]